MQLLALVKPFRSVAVASGVVALVFVVALALSKEGEISSDTGSGVTSGGLVGKNAPDFALPSLDGGRVSLEGLRGQNVVLNFWATWCVPCRAEMPELQQVYDEKRNQGVVVLAVNLKEQQGQVDSYVRELGLTFPVVLDKDGSVAESYKVLGLPTSVFIDRGGVIRNVSYGALNQSAIERRLKNIASQE